MLFHLAPPVSQDLSVAGLRKGLKHEENGDDETTRSGLFMEAIRIIKEMRSATNGLYPRFAIWENVPGAFSSNKGEDFRTVLEELIKIVEPSAVMPAVPKNGWSYADSYCGEGWSLAYRTFDAQYWGVPQRRRRIYLVLDLRGECAGEILFEREGLRGYFAEGRTPWQGAAADVENSTGADDREGETAGSVAYDQPICCYDIGEARLRTPSEYMEKSPTITARCGTGGNNVPAVVCPAPEQYLFENHSQDTRYKGPLDVCPMLPAQLGTGGNNTPFVVEGHTDEIYCIDGDKIGKAERAGGSGLGIREGDKMYTLTAKDAGTHSVAYSIGNGQVHDAMRPDKEISKTLNCLVDPAKVVIDTYNTYLRYIVRRLTPTECARLQGFADRWAVPDRKDDFTEEEYRFWLYVRNTHAAINGKAVKDYTEAQMLKWYNNLWTDSSEYKLWGNGIALPCALYVMQGIADAINQ